MINLNIKQMLLTPNEFSRPQSKLRGVRGVVLHWTANPKASAEANRNFFENRKKGKTGYGSAHYIVDMDGSIIQCIPENEVAYHVGANSYKKPALEKLGSYPNATTIGIEMVPINWDGEFTKETVKATIQLCVQLLRKYNLTANDLWRHFDIVGWGKDCPRYYVNHPDEWECFKREVAEAMAGKPPAVKKEEVAKIMSKYFKDIPAGMEWAAPHADSLYEKGVLKGAGNGNLKPADPLTRAEAAVLIDRAIEYVMKELSK